MSSHGRGIHARQSGLLSLVYAPAGAHHAGVMTSCDSHAESVAHQPFRRGSVAGR